jgi:hypothetical protein
MPPLTKPALRALLLNRKVVMMLLLVPYLLVELAFNHPDGHPNSPVCGHLKLPHLN